MTSHAQDSPLLSWTGGVESLLDGVNVWLNVYDQDMNLVFWNTTAETISGYTRQEVQDNHEIWEWLYPDPSYRNTVTERAVALLKTDSELDGFETNILCRDGSRKTISWSSRTLMDAEGSIQGAITFGRDVTDRKSAEEALHKAHKELSVLYNVASETSGTIGLSTILDRSLAQVLPALAARKGIIHLWDDELEDLKVAAYHGLAESSVSELADYSSGGGIIRQVFETEAPIALPNIISILENAPTNIPSKMFNAYLGVPMRAKGKLLGVLSILGKAEHEFTEDEIHLVTAVADQIGVAVENAHLYEQSRRLAVSEERRRLARELHDAITQSLYSLTLFAEAGRRSLNNGDIDDTDGYLTDMGSTAHSALREMRLLLHELRPLHLESEGMIEAIQHRIDSVESRVGIKARLERDVELELIPDDEDELYRIIQEALNNTLRHSSATAVTVTITRSTDNPKRPLVSIADDGIGFDLERAYNQGGIGLESMAERCKKLRADFLITSTPGKGTVVSVGLPGPIESPGGETDDQ